MPTVGVSGHRVLADLDKLETSIDAALDHIEEVFGTPLTLVSALAEGADRLVAEHVLSRTGARLQVVLPMDKVSYLADFRTSESRDEFERLLGRATSVTTLHPSRTREDAYLAGGEHVLRHGQVLLTIWDGQEVQGRGGTGSIVRRARDLGKPLAWIRAGNRKPGTDEPTTLGADQGRISYEAFVPAHPHFDTRDDQVDLDYWAPLSEALVFCNETIGPEYQSSNDSALRHQPRHRLITVLAGVFGMLAVLFAVLQLSELVEAPWLAGLEVLAAAIAGLSVMLGLLSAFHHSWLLERHRAERCRLLKFQYLSDPELWSGDPARIAAARERVTAELATISKLDSRTLVEWVEHDALPDPPLDLERGQPMTEPIKRLVEYYGAKRLGVQASYFADRASQNHLLDRVTRPFSPILFSLSVLAAGAHFAYDIVTSGHGDHVVSVVLIFLAAALAVIGAGVRAIRGAHEFARNQIRFRAKAVALSHLAQRLRQESDPARVLADMWCCEQILESEHREWLRLMLEAEWIG